MTAKITGKPGLNAQNRARRSARQPAPKSATPTRFSTNATSLPAVLARLADQTTAHAEPAIGLMDWKQPTPSSLDLLSQDRSTESLWPPASSATLYALAPFPAQTAVKRCQSKEAAKR